MFRDDQLVLAAEFQRNSVWPRAAKAYLIDTILNDRPIPVLYFQRTISTQTGRTAFTVIDGQQRLRAVFEFLDDRFRLTQSKDDSFKNQIFSQLPQDLKTRILNYDLVVEELSGYTVDDIVDMFVRMNKYVVKLSPQELRHAREKGECKEFVEGLGKLAFWRDQRVFSDQQMNRFRAVEFAAELTILLVEGPQDKKKALDLYYVKYRERFADAASVENRLRLYLRWVKKALPEFSTSRFRKPVDLYSLIGALDDISGQGKHLSRIHAPQARENLVAFEEETRRPEPKGKAARYVLAASRQTDNIGPRTTRIDILASLLE
jgi:hypothetical protein